MLQSKVRLFIFRLKIKENIQTKILKIYQILDNNGYESLNQSGSEEHLINNKLVKNEFNVKLPYNENSRLYKSDTKTLVNDYIIKFKAEVNEFYLKLDKKFYPFIQRITLYKDKITDNCFYSFFDFINLRFIGHYVIFRKNGTKIEVNIINSEKDISKGIIFYPNNTIYIGNLILEKKIIKEINNSNGLFNKRLELEDFDKVSSQFNQILKSNEFSADRNENQISESNTLYNYPNRNAINNHNISKENNYICNVDFINENVTFNCDNLKIEHSNLLKNKKVHISNCINEKSNNAIFIDDFENIESLEIIVNAYPCGEGFLIKENQIIKLQNWDNDFFKGNSDVKIINEKYELEVKIKNKIFDLSNIILFDYTNYSKYQGAVTYKNNQIKINNAIEEDNFSKFNFDKIIKNGKGKLFLPTGEIYEGIFENNVYHGEGQLFLPNVPEVFFNSQEFIESLKKIERLNIEGEKKNSKGILIEGCWNHGKLNGKGFVKKNNVREKCVWRFGRLVNAVLTINKRVKLNERIFDFLDELDLINLMHELKNKAMLNFLTKNDCKNLIKLKVFECLSYNVFENNNEINKFLAINKDNEANENLDDSIDGKSNKILNKPTNINGNYDYILPDIHNNLYLNHSMHFYNRRFYNYLCQDSNNVFLFDSLFQNCYDSYLPTIGVKCNGGYSNKLLHYSNAFDPSRSNNYSSNFVKSYGLNVDITGAFITNDVNFKEKILEKFSKSFNKYIMKENIQENKNNLISLDESNTNNIIILEGVNENFKNIEYICQMANKYKDIRKDLINKSSYSININNKNQYENNKHLNKGLIKFLFSIDYKKIFNYKKNLSNLRIERKNELENLMLLQKAFSKIAIPFSCFYKYDYNNRLISDTQVFEKLKISENSKFAINKILIDIPFNVHNLNKLTLPAKTLVFFLHTDAITKDELIKSDLDFENLEGINFSFEKAVDSIKDNISIHPKTLEIANDKFLSNFKDCIDDEYQLIKLLSVINKISVRKEKSNSYEMENINKMKHIKFSKTSKINGDINIINVHKNEESLFLEFDTQNLEKNGKIDFKTKLLGICFLKDYDLPNIIYLKPYYHFGKMITVRLVNQNILIANHKPSSIDIGSITFFGEEFNS